MVYGASFIKVVFYSICLIYGFIQGLDRCHLYFLLDTILEATNIPQRMMSLSFIQIVSSIQPTKPICIFFYYSSPLGTNLVLLKQ